MNLPDIHTQKLLDCLTHSHLGFALYRLPWTDECYLVLQTSGDVEQLADIQELNEKKGFVMAPFRISEEHPLVLIRPDVTAYDWNEISEALSSLECVDTLLTCKSRQNELSPFVSEETDKEQYTRDILAYKDTDGQPIVEKILDTAGQKGTGKWTGIAALDEGVPLTLIGEAVFARCLSAMKDERVEAAKEYARTIPAFTGDKAEMVEAIRQALYASKIISYAQGYTLMRTAAKTYGWNLNYGGIALMWRGGCIIRSVFLGKIKEAYDKNPELRNLLLDPYFKETMQKLIPAWRKVAAAAVSYGVPAPAMTAALSYFDGYTTDRLPANLLQAQRDYFGAHTYERLDSPRGQFFHTNWTGHGGNTAASTYNA